MELINNLMCDHLMHAIGWTIIHSLWQASFVALMMSIYLNRYQNEPSVVRYRIALSSLYIMLGLSIITFCIHYFNPSIHSGTIVHAAGAIDISNISGSHYIQDITFGLVHHFDFITTMWITGMIVFALKFLGGYALIKHYELSGQVIPDSKVHVILNDLLDKLNLYKPVEVLESAKVYTPMMVGHLKPVILLPMGIINQLELNEVEAILAHELSHISRNDFLQNILQSFIEIMYYYHPAVWWISANVRAERENCCDEEAVRLCGSAMNYAKTLVKIEEMQNRAIPSLAIPMARSKNNLLNRVSRILHQPQNKSQIKEKLIATLMLFSVFTVFGESNATVLNVANEVEEVSVFTSDGGHFDVTVSAQENCNCPVEETNTDLVRTIIIDSEDSHVVIDTIPNEDCNCNDVTIESNGNDRSFKLKIDNGVIKELKINGQEINDASKYLKLDENGTIKWADTSEHSKVIWNNNGELLLKEFKQGFEVEKDDKFRNYDFEEIEENEVLKAPFKIDGSYSNESMELYDAIREEIKQKDHLHKDFFAKLNAEGNISGQQLEELFENLAEHQSLGDEFFVFPEPPTPPKVPRFNFSVPTPPTSPTPPTLELRSSDSFFNQKPSSRIFRSLLSDGLIESGEENTLELTDKHLKINGEKMPSNIWKKYKKIYESQLGHEIMEGSKIKLKERTKANSRFFIG